MFEILEHTADIGFRVWGKSQQALFENAALALESLAVELDDVQPAFLYALVASGEDEESLLVNWLSEVLFHLDGRQVVMRQFQVDQLTSREVIGRGWGEPRDPVRHPSKLVVKGVTYHQLKMARTPEGWCAEVYLDI